MLKNKSLNKLEEKNLKTVCRLCLMNGYFLRGIYGTKIPYMIEYCLNIKISQSELPTNICARCFRQIVRFYTFKRKMERNDRALKEVIELRSNTKDLINIALQNSDINPLHSEYCSITEECSEKPSEKPVKITTKNGTITDYEPSECQNVYHKSVPSPNGIWDLSVPSNPPLGTFQRQQIPLSTPYNIEPPPLAPLQSNSNLNRNIESTLNDSLINKNFSSVTDMLQPPPLVAIFPVKTVSDIEGRITAALTKLSCNTCKQEFQSLHSLQDHNLKCCKLITYECNMCKVDFADQKTLAAHLKTHKTTKEHLCNVCGKKYSTQSTFIIHFRSHTGERPFKCNICGKGFVRWAGVKNHMKTHEDFKPHKCTTCDKQFKDISNLYRHQRLHTGKYTFRCSFCGKAFFQSYHLVLHIRTYHTKEKPYLCCECGKGFVSFQRLTRHELVHSGQKPYPCTLCLRAYSNRIDLENHNLRVHNKNGNIDEIKKYSCTVCGLRFWHPCRLKKHMNTHGDPKKNC